MKIKLNLITFLFYILTFSLNTYSQTWSALGGGMGSWVYNLKVYNNDLIAGGNFTTAGGLGANYIAKWNGTNWATLGSGMSGGTYNSVFALTVYNNDLIAGGAFQDAGGVIVNYVAKWFSPFGIKSISYEIPKSFSLSQNYPNPFNPTTNIEFAIPKNSFAKLIIYDITGREVQTLVNEELKAGTYKVDFDGTNLASGIYFYKLETDNFSSVKKMVLIK